MASGRLQILAALMAGAVCAVAPAPAWAGDRDVYQFDLPTQSLGDALRAVAAKAGWELYASADDINGVSAPSLHGAFTAREAIEKLVRDTDLAVRFDKGAVIVRERAVAVTTVESPSDIVVTGSRIRGAPSAAPVKTITSEDMRRAGQTDLGEVLRSSPLSFGGGQNPGIGTTQGNGNENVNGASSVNLFGLGPNATLTLLDGSRLSYTGVNAAVDISAIPAIAVDRVEIVADGASAIYGSDAVAGVVNVILRQNYAGLSVGAKLGAATDGGDFQQQYSAVGGKTWRTGSILAVYDYSGNSPIAAGTRSYTSSMSADSSIYPRLQRHSGLVGITQKIGGGLTANVDLLYKNLRQGLIQSFTDQPYKTGGGDVQADVTSFAVAPTVTARLGGDWTARLVSSYGRDRTRVNSDIYYFGSFFGTSFRGYDNDATSIELNAEGPVFDLPAGSIRVAFGAGYRRTSLNLLSMTLGITTRAFDRHRDNRFGYAETFIPLLSPEQESKLGRSLSLTAAFRYEANSGVGSVGLPKLGFIYEPIEGVTVKGSWGRSFRLPALAEQYSGYSAALYSVAPYATGFPAGSTFIALAGANPDMEPERSENWTISAELQPRALPGITSTLSYFHFDYRDRIAAPILSAVGALNNPTYASLVTLNPDSSLQQALAAGATIGLQNGTGAPYNSSTVVAILDERTRNVAREKYEGLNLSFRYMLGDATHQKLDFSFDGVWICSDRQLLPGLSKTDLAGVLFNPPRLRGRFGLTYATPVYSLSGFANLSSGLIDNRAAPTNRINGPSTFDLSATVMAGHGFDFGITVNNLFNAKPPIIVTGSGYDTPYDSTNFSAVGRFISVSLRKSW